MKERYIGNVFAVRGQLTVEFDNTYPIIPVKGYYCVIIVQHYSSGFCKLQHSQKNRNAFGTVG